MEAPNDETPANVEQQPASAEEEPTKEVSEKAASDSVKEDVEPVVAKKPRGIPNDHPKPTQSQRKEDGLQ